MIHKDREEMEEVAEEITVYLLHAMEIVLLHTAIIDYVLF